MPHIISEINDLYNVDVRIKCNEKNNQNARQTAAWIMRYKYNLPLKTIAAELGLKTPSGAMRLALAGHKNRKKLFLEE